MRGLRRNLQLATAILGVSVLAPTASAQSVVKVTGTPCRECRIERDLVMTFAGKENEMVGPHLLLARDSRRRWLLSTIEGPRGISVYDSAGRRLQDFGRRGQGPGEHSTVTVLIVTRGDSIHMFDNALRRHTVFSPGYQYVRSSSYPGLIWQAAELADGDVIVNGALQTPGRVGLPLHRLNRDGSVQGSFGAQTTAPRIEDEFLLPRHFALAGGDRIWSVSWNANLPTLWSADGMVSQLQRDASWFPPGLTQRGPGRSEPPTPLMMGILLDDTRHLWTMSRVPDAKWTPQAGARARAADTRQVIEWDREYDTIVEIVDTRTGQLVVSHRFDEALWRLLPGGQVTWYREDSDGEPYVEVWQLRQITPDRR